MALSKEQATRNIKIEWWVYLVSWITFLVPIISIFYKYTWLSTFEIILVSNIFSFWIQLFELPTSVLADTMWRRKSMMASVICNFVFAALILFLPNLTGFCLAAVFQALYYSFWSGTWQAFLEENLSVLGEEEKFWRIFGKFSFYERIPYTITPLIASFILKIFPDIWYTILASLDVIFAFALVILTRQLTETLEISEKTKSFKQAIKLNIDTGINAVKDVFGNKEIRNFLFYRSLSHHTAFFWVLLLPILADKWMLDWVSGLITTLFSLWCMLATKYVYKWWEKYGYNSSWVYSTIWQWLCLVVAWIFFKSWIFLAIIYLIFSIFDGLITPSRNHLLVKIVKWKSIATTRSIIFSCTALYMTLMKRILSYIQPNIALIVIWIVMLSANIIFAKQMLHGENTQVGEK